MATPANTIIRETTRQYLDAVRAAGTPKAPHIVEKELLEATNKELRVENAMRRGALGKDADANEKNQIPLLKHLDFTQVADVVLSLHRVALLAPVGVKSTSRERHLLGVYADSGPAEGTYVVDEMAVRGIARLYNRSLRKNDMDEVLQLLREQADIVTRCENRDLLAVANGVFDYSSKELLPFSPDLVFLTKIPIEFDPHAESPRIVMPDGAVWEVESWIRELSDDEGVPELLWQLLGALVRPGVRWKKGAFLHSDQGNNGKGTFAVLGRHLVGPESCVSIPMADFGKDFMLEPLTSAQAIIVDENDVGGYLERAANLKAVITNDVIGINRKNKMPIAYQFWGLMIQCVNDMPRTRDRSESFYRRQLFVPFRKRYEGVERSYIKEDYVTRPDVLRYVLKRVLIGMPDYYEFSVPPACAALLNDYREVNDPIRIFWAEHREEFAWDLLPTSFLYAMYLKWTARNNPTGKPASNVQFSRDLLNMVELDKDDIWFVNPDRQHKWTTGKLLAAPEPLIGLYDLEHWKSSTYSGKDHSRIGMFDRPASRYRGIVRRQAVPSAPAAGAGASTSTEEEVI